MAKKKGKKGGGAAAPEADNVEEVERKAMIKSAAGCANQTKKVRRAEVEPGGFGRSKRGFCAKHCGSPDDRLGLALKLRAYIPLIPP